MGMSFDKYIDNPSGSSVYTNRMMYKKMYQDKFNNLLIREQGQIKYELYRTDDHNDTFYIYMKIPSEVIEKFYYDVVIQLYTTDNRKKNNANLREYDVKFYSNDPAFVYTFAHSFIKNKLFIEDLKPRMSKQAIKSVAKIRNPKDEVWYVKSLYFAYLAMERYNLFSRIMFSNHSKKYDKKELLRKVMQAEDKVKLRQSEQEKLDKLKKEEKSKIEKKKRQNTNQHIASKKSNISKTSRVSTVSKTPKTAKKAKVIGKK